MGIGVRILKHYALIVASLSGPVGTDEVRATIKRLQSDADFVWNFDRIVFVDGGTDMSELDLDALFAIKRDIIRAYFGGREPDRSELPAYRIAIVCEDAANAGIMKLFGAVWDMDQSPYIEVQRFDAAHGALSWLGRDAVSEHELRGEIPS